MRKSCSKRSLEQLLGIFRALQTSRVLHISMNVRLHMNQLLIEFKFRFSPAPLPFQVVALVPESNSDEILGLFAKYFFVRLSHSIAT